MCTSSALNPMQYNTTQYNTVQYGVHVIRGTYRSVVHREQGILFKFELYNSVQYRGSREFRSNLNFPNSKVCQNRCTRVRIV